MSSMRRSTSLKVALQLEASARWCSLKNVFLKTLCQNFFFNKVKGWRFVALLQKILRRRCFLVNYVKFIRAPYIHFRMTASAHYQFRFLD